MKRNRYWCAGHSLVVEADDSELWALAVPGDGESFGAVFDRHRDRVRRHLTRLLASPQDVEDAVAVVFMEAWRRRASVRLVQGSVLPWLLVTATYTANNVRRSARRYRVLLERLPQPEPAWDEASALEESDMGTALRRLSQADQQILTLCVLEEWSERDAAEALRVRPGTVKSRLHRAKKRLAGQFEILTATGEGVGHGV